MFKIITSFLFSILFSTLLFSQGVNPRPYAALGDVIYDNVDNIEKLQELEHYQLYKKEIAQYILEVKKAKQEGIELESKSSSKAKKLYLTKLRELSKKNDNYLRDINSQYKSSMKDNDFLMFTEIINSGIIDTNERKKEIIDYYYLHSDDINSSGIIDEYLNEDAELKALKDAQRKRKKSKKTLQEEKIKRIRALDLQAQKKLEEQLQKDVMNKKLEIRENQKKELAN